MVGAGRVSLTVGGMSRFLMRAAVIMLSVAWLLHAVGTVWRPEAAAEVAAVLTARSHGTLGDPVAAVLADAGIEGVDAEQVGAALASSRKVGVSVAEAAGEVWEAELEGRAARFTDALGWTVDVARGENTTTVTLDATAITDALTESHPEWAQAWRDNPALHRPVTVDVSGVANVASIGALPAAVASWAWTIAALGLITAALATVVAVGRRAATVALLAWVLIAAGAATYLAMRALGWAAQRGDAAGLAAEVAATAGAPLSIQALLVVAAGVAALRIIGPAR